MTQIPIKRKVLLIGWDAADWKIMQPLLDAGELPCVQKLISNGASGNLATHKPVLSPMLWNSIATGKRPSEHGILGFTELNPHTGTVGPSLSTSRKSKAIWNIVSQLGGKAHVVNWFASHPAEKINGVCVSETYSTPPRIFNDRWELSPEAIHPQAYYSKLRELRIRPTELDGDVIEMFCRLAGRVDQSKDQRLGYLAKQIAEAINVHSAATLILANEDWDFMGVYHGAIDHFCHLFMHFHPPQRPDVSDEDFEIYQDVVNNCYRFHDRMLGRMIELAGDDATVIICSDHGFRSDNLRPPYTPGVPTGPAYWHRDQGILLMSGPGIAAGEQIYGATLLDIAPTVLSLMGIGVGKDMPGRVLTEAFDDDSEVSFVDSWENRVDDFPDGMHPPNLRLPPEESQAILEQFVALGYVDPLDDDADKAALDTQRESKWNLALSHIDANDVPRAIPLLIQLVNELPHRKEIILTLANCLQGIGLVDQAQQLVMVALRDETDQSAAKHTLAEIAIAKGNSAKARRLLDEMSNDTQPHRKDFADFYDLGKSLTLGASYLKLRDRVIAEKYFRNALRLDPDNVRAIHGVTQCLMHFKQFDQALPLALHAVELEYRSFLGHYLLGVILARLEDWNRSAEALNVALKFKPNHIAALRVLVVVCRQQGNQTLMKLCKDRINLLLQKRDDSKEHPPEIVAGLRHSLVPVVRRLRDYYDDLDNREPILDADRKLPKATTIEGETNQQSGKQFVIVSGLPRSGTSLMMQMLNAGGIPAMTDGNRAADDDNPLGYLEWERIKKLKAQPDVIEKTEGYATKVISMLLPHLPPHHRYKIVFMIRPIQEVVASQQKMISKRETEGANLSEERLVASLVQHRDTILKMLSRSPCVELLLVDYHHVISQTKDAVTSIAEFFGSELMLDQQAMCEVVNPSLWRNRLVTDTETRT